MQITLNLRFILIAAIVAIGLFFFTRTHQTEAVAAAATLDYEQAKTDAATMLAYCAFVTPDVVPPVPAPQPVPKPDSNPATPAVPIKPKHLSMPTLAPDDGTTFTIPVLASVMVQDCPGGVCPIAKRPVPASSANLLPHSPKAGAGFTTRSGPLRKGVGVVGKLIGKIVHSRQNRKVARQKRRGR